MRIVFIVTSLFLSAFFELVLGGSGFLENHPSLIAIASLFWFSQLEIIPRFLLAVAVGFLLDSISLFPFGVELLSLVLLSLFTECLRRFFSDHTSLFTRGLSFGIVLLFFIMLTPRLAHILPILIPSYHGTIGPR